MPELVVKLNEEVKDALKIAERPFAIYFKNKDNLGCIVCPEKQTLSDTELRKQLKAKISGAENDKIYYGYVGLNGVNPEFLFNEGTDASIIPEITEKTVLKKFAVKIGYDSAEKFNENSFKIGGAVAVKKSNLLNELKTSKPTLKSVLIKTVDDVNNAKTVFENAIGNLSEYLSNKKELKQQIAETLSEKGVTDVTADNVYDRMLNAAKKYKVILAAITGVIEAAGSGKATTVTDKALLLSKINALRDLIKDSVVLDGMQAAVDYDKASSDDIEEIKEEFFGPKDGGFNAALDALEKLAKRD